MTRCGCGRLAATLLLFSTSVAMAHHGFAPHYDPEQYITVEGVITDIEFVNPHSFVYIETTDDTGDTVVRWCEMQSRTQLERKGITEDSFALGGRISVGGFQARRDPLGCEFGDGDLPNGASLTLRNRIGQSQYLARVVESESGVFGTWHRKAFPGAGSLPAYRDFFTEAALAAIEGFDPIADNPILMCDPMSPIQTWAIPGTPTEIRRDGENVVIQHEFMDLERVVHLNMAEHPEDAPRSVMGYSIGRFEGEDLVIETARFSPGFIHSGVVHSEDFEFSERLTIDPENGGLVVTWSATDPVYYSEPLYGSRIMIRTDFSIGPYDCVPGLGHEATID